MAGDKVGTGYVPIKPDTDGFGAALEKGIEKEAGPASKRAGEKISKIAAGAAAAGAALIGKSLMDFGSFEKGMNEVFTLLPGISGEAMEEMKGQVKDFSVEFGVLPTETVPALYEALGAGVPPDNIFTFLETAQKLAKGGVTDLATSVDGLSSVVNAYGEDVISAGEASDIMFKIVGLGKGTLDDVASSLFNVTPIASALGVSFEDVGAAMAVLSAKGTPVSVATTQIRAVLGELGKDGTKVSDMFRELSGKTFAEFIAGGGDLAGALAIIDKGATESGLSIMDMFGSIEAGSAALSLMEGGGEAFIDATKQMENAAGSTEAAYNQMNKGLSVTIERLRARFSVVMLNIGEAVAPTFEAIGNAVAGALELFSKLPGPMQAVVVIFGTLTAGAIAFAKPILNAITLFSKLGKVFSLLAANPWIIVVAGLVAITYVIIRNWDTVKAAALELWNTITMVFDSIVGAITGAWQWIVGVTTGAWNTVWGIVSGIGSSVISFIVGIPTAIGEAFTTLANIISAPFETAFNLIKRLWNNTIGGFGFTAPDWIPLIGGKSFRIPEMAMGGVLAGPQLFLGGEYAGAATNPEIVTPQNIMRETVTEALQQNGTAGGAPITVEVHMHVTSEVKDPSFFEARAAELARVVSRELERKGIGRGIQFAGVTR